MSIRLPIFTKFGSSIRNAPGIASTRFRAVLLRSGYSPVTLGKKKPINIKTFGRTRPWWVSRLSYAWRTFLIFFIFVRLGEGEGGVRGRRGGGVVDFLLKIPEGGGVSPGGAEGPGGCLRQIGDFWGGVLNIFFRGRNVHQVWTYVTCPICPVICPVCPADILPLELRVCVPGRIFPISGLRPEIRKKSPKNRFWPQAENREKIAQK